MGKAQAKYVWKAITLRGEGAVVYFLNENNIHPDNIKIVRSGDTLPQISGNDPEHVYTVFFYPSPDKKE